MKFHILIYWGVREKHTKYILISCGCMLLFTFSCKHGSDGVSTWTKFDGHIYPVIMQKYLPLLCIMRFVVVYT